jgi:hypothetical protein
MDWIENALGHVPLNFCFFASAGIYRSSSALQCVQGKKHRCTIFHARVGPVRFQ